MKLGKLTLVILFTCVCPGFVTAQEVNTSITLGAATHYQYRGASQNVTDDAQVAASLDIESDRFYVGTSASNVDFGTKARLEIDAYGGFRRKFGAVELDLGVLGYFYPQEPDFRTFEVKAEASIASQSGISLTAGVFYSPESGKDGPSYSYTELAASLPIPALRFGPFSFSLNAAFGSSDYEANPDLPDYTNWKLDVTAATENGWAISVFYTDTNVADIDTFKARTVMQVSRSF